MLRRSAGKKLFDKAVKTLRYSRVGPSFDFDFA